MDENGARMMASPRTLCRLYLKLSVRPSTEVESAFAQVIAGADVACVLFGAGEVSPDMARAGKILRLAHERDIAVLVEEDAQLAQGLGADGVQITANADAYSRARTLLGNTAIVGVDCGINRHDAMTFAELGADYVAFGSHAEDAEFAKEQRAELIAWWSEIFVVPCIALDVDDAADANHLASLGADFIALSEHLWRGENAVDRIMEIAASVTQARSAA
jgi:thiamine-phosphate pyrophosphorylase